MARGPLHRPRFARPAGGPPGPPHRVAVAVRAARLGAVLAAVVALLLLVLRYQLGVAFPFDPQFLVLLAFVAPIVLALVRVRAAGRRRGIDPPR